MSIRNNNDLSKGFRAHHNQELPMKMDIAKKLISLGAVKFSPSKPFTYASGLRGPIYCDNRLVLSHVEFRDEIIKAFISLISFHQFQFDLIGGIATAGIPHASIISDRMKKPLIYIRPKPKGHGKMNQVEGDYKAGQKVLLVEDLVNAGSSLVEAMDGLKLAELSSQLCLCIVDYEMKSSRLKLKEQNIELFSLTDFTSLSLAALELRLVNQVEFELLKSWQADPEHWSTIA